MNNSRIIAVAMLALAVGKASAIGSDPLRFTGTRDASFFVTLGPDASEFSRPVTGVNSPSLANDERAPEQSRTLSIDKTATVGPTLVGNTMPGTQSGGLVHSPITFVSAASEPTATAMLVAGLGVFGFVGRRRKL